MQIHSCVHVPIGDGLNVAKGHVRINLVNWRHDEIVVVRSKILLILQTVIYNWSIHAAIGGLSPLSIVLFLEIVHDRHLLILALQALFSPEILRSVLDPILTRIATGRVHQSIEQFTIFLINLPLPIELLCSVSNLNSWIWIPLLIAHSLLACSRDCVHLWSAHLIRILSVYPSLLAEWAKAAGFFWAEVTEL